jgi:hypothetical protein
MLFCLNKVTGVLLMKRNSLYLSLTVVLVMWPGAARAQYGFGGGWGGWGGGGTAQGSMARGMGMFSMGAGMYNRNTAEAASMNATTRMRWNSYIFQGQQAANQRYHNRQKARLAATNKAYNEIQDRLRKNPSTLDITDGDALNVLLDVLLNPAVADQSLQLIKTPLRAETIANIPFEVATECITVCIASITDEEWPLPLRGEIFKPEREALHLAVQNALKEDETGDLEPETIDAVQKAITNLRLKFVKQVPQDAPDYVDAQAKIKALAGLIKMLDSSKIEKVLAELEDYQGTTLGDLLAFMQAFNLRFSAANSYRQRQIYQKLYPMLADQANGTLGSLSGGVAGAANQAVAATEGVGSDLKSAAVSLFKDMGWDRF